MRKRSSPHDVVDLVVSLCKLRTKTHSPPSSRQQPANKPMAFVFTSHHDRHQGNYAIFVYFSGCTDSKQVKLLIDILQQQQQQLCARELVVKLFKKGHPDRLLGDSTCNNCLHFGIPLDGLHDSTQHKDVMLYYFNDLPLHGKLPLSITLLLRQQPWRKCETADLQVTEIEDTVLKSLLPCRIIEPNCLDVKPNDTGQAWKSLLLLGDNGCTFSIDQPLSQPGSVSSGEGKAAELNEGNVTGHPPEQSKTSPAKAVSWEAVAVSKELEAYGQCSSGEIPRPFTPEWCDSPIVHDDIPNTSSCGVGAKGVSSAKVQNGNVNGFQEELASKASLSDSVIRTMELCEKVSRVELLRKDKAILRLKKSNAALRKTVRTGVQHCQCVKWANHSLTKELEEIKEELENCLSDMDKYAQEAHILKLENACLAARLADYEAIKNKWEAAQLQLFKASTERDHYREKSLELKVKLLQETEAREATDRERRRLFYDYELLQKAYKELKRDKESSALDDQVFQLDDFHTRLSMLQSEVVSLRDEHSIVKIHRDKFGSNLRQFASEHDSLKEQFMSFAKDLFESVQMKMVQSIDEYERLETAQDTVAEHVKAATLQSKTAENELRKMERETELYRRKLTDIPHLVGQEMFHLVIPNTVENWREFAMYLGVDACTILAVEAEHDTAEDCCKKIISHWREGAGKVPKTWATILEAMHLCGLTRGAKRIEETLCSK